MNAKMQQNNVDRNELIRYITKQINKNPEKEFEISATDLAKKFGVQGPTMDYHLKKLLEDEIFYIASKKGRYARKIFVLDPSKAKPKAVVNNMDAFKDIIKNKIDAGQIKLDVNEAQEDNTAQEPVVDITNQRTPAEILNVVDTGFARTKEDEAYTPIDVVSLSLNEKIENFLWQSKNVTSADTLISKSDKEVLSVITETIQQEMTYLKDLSNQLELMENLKLLHQLIDEREKMQEEMKQIRKEHSQVLKSISNNENKVDVDPQRVRLMHQIIINTVDSYVDLPNASLALQRKEFRNKITKEVSDLANYIIGIEK